MPFSHYSQEFIDACNACIAQWEECTAACKEHISCLKDQGPDGCNPGSERCIELCQLCIDACKKFIAIGRQHLKTTADKHKDKQVAEHANIEKCIEECEQCIKACTECIESCEASYDEDDIAKNIKYCNECIVACQRCIKACKACLAELK